MNFKVYLINNMESVTIDRGIDPKIVFGIEDKAIINLISGSFLAKNIEKNYCLLKEILQND